MQRPLRSTRWWTCVRNPHWRRCRLCFPSRGLRPPSINSLESAIWWSCFMYDEHICVGLQIRCVFTLCVWCVCVCVCVLYVCVCVCVLDVCVRVGGGVIGPLASRGFVFLETARRRREREDWRWMDLRRHLSSPSPVLLALLDAARSSAGRFSSAWRVFACLSSVRALRTIFLSCA